MLNFLKKEKKKYSEMTTQQKSFGSKILNFDWCISTNQLAEGHKRTYTVRENSFGFSSDLVQVVCFY
jgi:hypothetical protein